MRDFNIVMLFMTILGCSPTAQAHAFLDHASPLVGRQVAASRSRGLPHRQRPISRPQTPVILEINLVNVMVAPNVQASGIIVQFEIVVDQQCSFVEENAMVGA